MECGQDMTMSSVHRQYDTGLKVMRTA